MQKQKMNNQTQQTIRILPQRFITFILNSMDKLTIFFIRLKITPNMITIWALLFGLAAGAFFALAAPLWAGIMIIISGAFDIMDGKVAAHTNKKSLFGAIFDSTLDRYSEFFIYLGLAVYFRNHWALWICFLTFLGSTMVSYTRARAEGLGITCKLGIMQRAERMMIIVLCAFIGLIFNIYDPVMIGALGVIALISNITALQRTFYVKKVEKQQESKN